MGGSAIHDLRVLIYAPIGRDSALTADLLDRGGIACHVCASVLEVCLELRTGAGAVLLTEEALADPQLGELAETLATQPAWSDISVLLFAGDDRNQAALRTLRTLEVLRNVTLLDRPIRITAVLSTVRAALRGRQRQYELRDVLVALHTARGEAERSRDDAQRANRLKDEFLATLSHELRTPLNAILGWVALLRAGKVEASTIPRILETLERNARSQAQLIADVLDVSRMITGRVALRPTRVNLVRLLHEAVDSMRPATEAKRIEIGVVIPDDLPGINGDEDRLRQVFWNLLSNAVKFTPQGGRVDVRVSAGASDVEVVVSDTGIGIPPEFLPYAFDRFRQADQSFTRPHGGLGLGLAIVKHLTELHGGEVAVSSEGLGRGSQFRLRLPVASTFPHPEAADPASPLADTEEFERPDLSDRFILVVDDDPETRELLVAILAECGARVATADSAKSAFDIIEAETPSLMVADVGMPGQDGLTMMRIVRQRAAEAGGEMPAVALSAYARAEDRRAALAAGFDEFVTKPATPTAIVRAIERGLSAPVSKSSRPARAPRGSANR